MRFRRVVMRFLRDHYYFFNKKTFTTVIFFLIVLGFLLIIKHEVNTTDQDFYIKSSVDMNSDLILNDNYKIYELNKQIYEINDEFKSKIDQMYKLVHLDLKGSPPKLPYLKNLIKYFHKIGINGVLIEYEDMFPYDGLLASIRNRNSYKKDELDELFKLLIDNNFLIIPLIQTYGHLEFVLKLNEFKYLREIEQHYQVITPCLSDTYDKVIFPMIDQILDLHPSSLQYIHIGCDEVYHVGKHSACSSLNFNNVQDYFMHHVTKIIDYIHSKRPNLKVIIWDDMIRKNFELNTESTKLQNFAKRFEPMVWNYNEKLYLRNSMWRHYATLFDKVWLAGAFKGATYQKAILPNVTKHHQNNLEWMKIIHKNKKRIDFSGIVYTGWSRYDHLIPICELMPAAIPSLVFVLSVFMNYGNLENAVSQFKMQSGCNYKNSPIGFILEPVFTQFTHSEIGRFGASEFNKYTCDFPGNYLYSNLMNLKILIDFFELKHRLYASILDEFNLENGYINTMNYDYALNAFYPVMKNEFTNLDETISKYFVDYFYDDLIIEFRSLYIKPYLTKINSMINKLNVFKVKDSLPVRPYNK